MDLLLDTHVFLWWDADDPQLGGQARSVIGDPSNKVFVSAATSWEITIKRKKGKLSYSGSPSRAILQNRFLPLPIDPLHAEAAGDLDWDHTDPFDRVLVAQAQSQRIVLVHADRVIADFRTVSQLWAR